ncbi:hypothetical protein IST4119_02763 [Burkholderia multivorans]|nr:hypothetical protein IST4119_02763 [Burkholderia multivorans]
MSGARNACRASAYRSVGERRNAYCVASAVAAAPAANAPPDADSADESASSARVGAGSAVPKPSKICRKVGTTHTISAAAIASANRITTAG